HPPPLSLPDALPILIGASLAALVHPDDLPEALNAFAGVLQDHRMARRLRARLAVRAGGWRWIECTLFPGRVDTTGEVVVSYSLRSEEYTSELQSREK